MPSKVREVHCALLIEESCQYNVIKAAILKVHEFVPEAYHQKFHNSTKRDNQTYVKFARSKETLFDQ